ncbi:MAG: CCA tRNA nucleotidyltransferase [Methanotrichaceae archaeon]|nr:CCA tRNA nucleotidyltransferase [Methanotrichaceae archaeon]
MLGQVRPTLSDRERLTQTSATIIARIEDLAREHGISLKTMLVGSAARGTWLAGDHDLDIFLGVPPGDDLGKALELARQVAPDHEEKYAEHAYVNARMDGFEVDLVPCYLVEDAAHLKSAVDRTPFHTKYVASRIIGREDDVLLLKQFMKGADVYGSELKMGGFSGYLAELLVLCYGSFPAVLQAASTWKPGLCLDLEGHGIGRHDEPLIVVDPVDPGRNVAAALTLDKMLQFAAAARSFLAEPKLDFFFAPPLAALSDEEIVAQINARGTMLILIELAAPDVVEDVLYPQLRKAEGSIKALLERSGFSLLRSDVSTYRDRAVMLFEMQVWQLSRACQRIGPPVWQAAHLSRFLAAHPHPLSGPYIANGKVVVEEARRYTSARDLLAGENANLSMGKHLSASIRCGHNIYMGQELLAIKDEGFRIFLAHYFQAKFRVG